VVLELMLLMSMVILLVVPLVLPIATVMLVEMMALVSIGSAASGDRTGSLWLQMTQWLQQLHSVHRRINEASAFNGAQYAPASGEWKTLEAHHESARLDAEWR
jgi:hypothetical protein